MENEPIDPGALYVFNNRKTKAEGRKPIENEPRGHSGDHYSGQQSVLLAPTVGNDDARRIA